MRLTPTIIIGVAYAILTAIAGAAQDTTPWGILREWMDRTGGNPMYYLGHSNLQKWVSMAGYPGLKFPLSMGLLGLLGIWLFIHRKIDIWIQIGVAAFVAHIWAYHRSFDDLIQILSLVGLYRIAGNERERETFRIASAVFFVLCWAALLIPARLFDARTESANVIEGTQIAIFAATCAFMIIAGHRARKSAEGIA
jgi:hypothetical protein